MNVAKKERACRACVRCAKAMRRRRCVVAMALLVLVSSCRDEVAEVAVHRRTAIGLAPNTPCSWGAAGPYRVCRLIASNGLTNAIAR